MTYSIDLRTRVVAFVAKGGSKIEASDRFGVSRKTVYNWLAKEDLRPKAHGPRRRKLDRQALRAHVATHPDALIRERAAHFGVSQTSIWHGLNQLRISVKKNAAVSRKKST
jgi:transposase